jgi:hypothetical protein
VAAGAGVLVVAYALTRAAQRREGRARATAPHPAGGTGDPRAAAEAAALRGEYAAASHHLYAAVLAALEARGLVRLHPSRTAGDYARELRRAPPRPARAADPALAGARAAAAGAYAPFARGYEAVVYGPHPADRARYEALRAAAAPLLAAASPADAGRRPRTSPPRAA